MRLLLLLALLAAPAQAKPVLFDFDRALAPVDLHIKEFKPTPLAVPKTGISTIIIPSATGREITPRALISSLAQVDLVYVGEGHDQVLHHWIQAEVIKGLHALKPDLQIGLEMLDITQQETLDAYLDGSMSEDDFKEFWRKAWGYPFELYEPILSYAKKNKLPVKALNAPSAVIRAIVKKGLDNLTPEERALLPADIKDIQDPRYLKYVKDSLSQHGPMPPRTMARMLKAMAAWNETMGQSLLNALQDGPVVIVAGMGHVFYNAGILESVRNRANPSQAVVLPYPLSGEDVPLEELRRRLKDPSSDDIDLADYFWLLPQ